jgi:hypothetical protein
VSFVFFVVYFQETPMTKYLEFPLENGGTILIESSDEPEKGGAGFTRAGNEAVKEVAIKAGQTFDASIENIRKSADLLVQKLLSLSERPDEMTVNFSLKATGELGNLAIGSVGAEANYSVSLKWVKPTEKKDDKKAE